ncbi:CHASE3 domain-containing protein [Lysobacter xanthus]
MSRSSAAVLLGLALFVVLAAVGFVTIGSVQEASQARDRARDALLTGTRLLSSVLEVETGQRGYVLTGDPSYLAPYYDGIREAPQLVERFRRQVAHMPELQTLAMRIEANVARRIDISQRVVAERHDAGGDAAFRLAVKLAGRNVTQALRSDMANVDARLEASIQRWDRRATGISREARWAAIALTLLGTVLILASVIVLEREHDRRHEAEVALQDANARLEARVLERTAELEQARRQLQTFARRLDRQVESERRRLAREVHDQLGQVFTALKLTLTHTASKHPQAAEPLAQAITLLDEGVVTARRIASELRPPLLDDLGLGPAIDHRGQRFLEETGVACDVDVHETDGLSAEQSVQLFRIVQESLTNVARHAAASRVRIEGRVDGAMYRLSVEDNGRGMAEPRPSSLGMLSILERTLLSGGALVVDSVPGRGTRIEVRLPVLAQGETA